MPVFLSTVYSCGIACSSSRSCGIACARATSFARSTSDLLISSWLTATMPLLVIACTCSPAMPAVHILDVRARHPLGVLHRFPDRARGLFDVGHDAAAHAGRARLPDAEHFDRRVLRQVAVDFGDDGGRLRRPDVESSDEAFRSSWQSGDHLVTITKIDLGDAQLFRARSPSTGRFRQGAPASRRPWHEPFRS